MRQVTQEEAIVIGEKGLYKDWTDEQLVNFQIRQNCLCVPFNVFHGAISRVLNRDVYTHEFMSSNIENLIGEIERKTGAPNLDDIINLIPADKLIQLIK